MNRKQRRAEQNNKFASCTQDHPGPYRMPTAAEQKRLTDAMAKAILAEFQDAWVRELDTRSHLVMVLRAVESIIRSAGEEPIDYIATMLITLGSVEEVERALASAISRAVHASNRAND